MLPSTSAPSKSLGSGNGIKATLEKQKACEARISPLRSFYSLAMSMVTSTVLPPPTINSLGPSQRARLLKSTRKLENVLGAIPQVVEPENVPLYEKSKSQNVHVYNHAAFLVEPTISTAECLEHSEAASRNANARKHNKHRREYSESSADSAQELTLPSPEIATPSPLSSLFTSEDEPTSPIQAPQEKICQKRTEKLTRTFGENSPTEFILPHDHLRLTQHQRSPSEPSVCSLWPDWGEEESEVSNNTIPATVPLPAINSLDPSQRARLLKSTRTQKIFLGATPQLEESPLVTTNSRRIPFPVSSDPADPHDSLKLVPTSLRLSQTGPAEKQSKHKLVHIPRPLVLRHNNVSAINKLNVRVERPSSADTAQVLTLPNTAIASSSPLSPLFTPGDEPMSPIEVPQEKIRRKRMAKLTRTLGENIPTEFILPRNHLKLTQHQRSPSEPSPRSLWPNWGEKESEALSVTNNAMSTTLPPPTINSLDPSHRARLLKSTRKLENLLGATPQVEESAPVTTNSRRISFLVLSPNSPESRERVPTSLQSSQNESAEKHSKHTRSMQLPRPLVLRHHNESAVTKLNVRIEQPSSADPVQVLTLPHTEIASPSPLSPLFATGDEPMSPIEVPQERIRRMRMAKLTRTLGENIPTELILPHDRLKFTQHQRSPSEPAPHSLWPDWGGKDSEAASVVTTNTISTTVPPPTINSLDPSQRTRLLKSTRKLENLLGATPQVEESTMLSPVTENSSRISFPVSSSDSADSHDSLELVPTSLRLSQNGPAEKHKSVHLPRPLVLRHNNMSAITKLNVRIEQLSSADSSQKLTLPRTTITTPSPLSPLFATEDEPMSPMDVPQEKIRRMRMAKLTRTLGENIPTEFILTHDHLKLSKHQRSPSEPSPRSLWPDWTKEDEGTAALPFLSKRRPRIASVENNDLTFTNATTIPPHRSKPVMIRKVLRRPQSVGPEAVLSSTLFTVTPSSPERPSSPVILSESETTDDDGVEMLVGSDWRGEWNIKDAQERAMALRNLRGH